MFNLKSLWSLCLLIVSVLVSNRADAQYAYVSEVGEGSVLRVEIRGRTYVDTSYWQRNAAAVQYLNSNGLLGQTYRNTNTSPPGGPSLQAQRQERRAILMQSIDFYASQIGQKLDRARALIERFNDGKIINGIIEAILLPGERRAILDEIRTIIDSINASLDAMRGLMANLEHTDPSLLSGSEKQLIYTKTFELTDKNTALLSWYSKELVQMMASDSSEGDTYPSSAPSQTARTIYYNYYAPEVPNCGPNATCAIP